MANLRYFITSMRSKSIIVCGIENFSQRLFDFSSSVGLALEMTVYELSKPSSSLSRSKLVKWNRYHLTKLSYRHVRQKSLDDRLGKVIATIESSAQEVANAVQDCFLL